MPSKFPALDATASTSPTPSSGPLPGRPADVALPHVHSAYTALRRQRNAPDVISIPPEARDQPLINRPFSARLTHVLEWQHLRRMGDLEGRSFSEFLRFRNLGRVTHRELLGLIQSVHGGLLPAAAAPRAAGGRRDRADRFRILDAGHSIELAELPMSGRLERILSGMGVRRLGDLDGTTVGDLLDRPNCGRATLGEFDRLIRRVAAGELQVPSEPFSVDQTGALLNTLDCLLYMLPTRNRKILCLRFGAQGHGVKTLECVGKRFRLHKERIRQLEASVGDRLRRLGGPALAAALRTFALVCRKTVCPLTPALLSHWAGGRRTVLAFPPEFYVRLVVLMHPEIPGWPEGHRPLRPSSPKNRTILRALRQLLTAQGTALSFPAALGLLRAGEALRELKVEDFLAALHHPTSLVVRFPQPDGPEVELRRRR